jgi:hypothetical protein
LEPGDLIDGYDTTKKWFLAIVVEKKIVDFIGRTIPKIRVGFRNYCEDGNRREEETGKRYNGWAAKFDEWLSSYSPRIAKMG